MDSRTVTRSDLEALLAQLVRQMNQDELEVLTELAHRIAVVGRGSYGPLALARLSLDRLAQEESDEWQDAFIYRAMRAVLCRLHGRATPLQNGNGATSIAP